MSHKHGPVYHLADCIQCCRALFLSAASFIPAQKSMLAHIASIPGSPGAEGARKRLAEMSK